MPPPCEDDVLPAPEAKCFWVLSVVVIPNISTVVIVITVLIIESMSSILTVLLPLVSLQGVSFLFLFLTLLCCDDHAYY